MRGLLLVAGVRAPGNAIVAMAWAAERGGGWTVGWGCSGGGGRGLQTSLFTCSAVDAPDSVQRGRTRQLDG
jgi:hypothetical protein